MQSALPLFQETTVKTIEKFLAKKFYNDILYVKEKLGKRLQIAYNKKIDSDGRIKKIKFKDFVIQ
jgi:ribosomal protein L31E